jgi:hypothetical protein
MPRVVAWLERIGERMWKRVEHRLGSVVNYAILAITLLPLIPMTVLIVAEETLDDPAWPKAIVWACGKRCEPVLLVAVLAGMALIQVFFWLLTLGAAGAAIDSVDFLSPRSKGVLFRVVGVLMTGVFVLFWGGLVYTHLLHLGPMSIGIERAIKCTVVLSFGSLATAYLRCMPVPPGHTFRDLLRLGITTLAAMGTLLLLWSWGLGQHALTVWLHGRVPWLLPVLGLFVICALKWAGSLLRISPRRARLRVYGADAPAPACPKCRSSMKVRFRDAWCADCQRSVPIPAEWWVCGCGAPLRGVKGDCCVECGGEFRFREPPPMVMLDRNQRPDGDTPFGGMLTDSMDKSIDRSAPGERQDPT